MIRPTPSAASCAHSRRITFGRGSASNTSTRGCGGVVCLEHASHGHPAITRGFHGAHAEWTIEQTDSNLLTPCDTQHIEQVSGASIRERHTGGILAIVLLEKDQVHVCMKTGWLARRRIAGCGRHAAGLRVGIGPFWLNKGKQILGPDSNLSRYVD